MKRSTLLPYALAVPIVRAYLVNPPGTAAPGSSSQCSAWIQQSYALTCSDIVGYYGITLANFELWNPITTQLGPGCNLIASLYYCIAINYTAVTTPPAYTPSTLFTTISSTTTTTTSATKTTPSPLEPSTDPDCTTYYLVVSGDTCSAIETKFGLTAAQFNAWNPHVGTTCGFLDLGEYVCVGAPFTSISSTMSSTSTSSQTTSSTTTTATLSYPTPLQPNSWTNCSAYHLVVSGDFCSLLETNYHLTAAQFNSWNPGVGTSCGFLDLGDYVCVGQPIPTPLQAGTISTSTQFHLVTSGEFCSLIETNYGLTAAQFNLWNPGVGSTCAFLQLAQYVCVWAL